MKQTPIIHRPLMSSLMLAGLLISPLAAHAADFEAFTASNQTLSINGTAATVAATAYYVGNGFNHDTLAISNGGSLTISPSNSALQLGKNAADGSNSITVDGVGSILTISNGSLNLGVGSGTNSLTISNGGTVYGGTWGTVLGGSGSNSAVVTGAGSLWTTGNINLNGGGNNSVSVLAGAKLVNTGLIYVGNFSNSNTVTVSGAGTILNNQSNNQNNGIIRVGNETTTYSNNAFMIGAGATVNVTASGTKVSAVTIVGLAGATGNKVQIDGGTLNLSTTGSVTPYIDVQNGSLIVNANSVVNTPILTATTGATSVVNFNGGTINTKSTTINNGSLFTVGNGTSAATLNLNGGTHSFANGIKLANNATLAGTGTISTGALEVASGGTLSPGNSPGTLTVGSTTLDGGGNYNWQVLNAAGVAGTGYDTINLTAGAVLTLANTVDNKFNINLWSLSSTTTNGDATGFDNSVNQSWTLIATDQAISNFSAANFLVNVSAANGTGGLTNALGTGVFTVGLSADSTDLVLNYAAVPEPSTWAMLVGGVGMLAFGQRLRRRVA